MKITISYLLSKNAHLGHKIKYSNFKLFKYIYGILNGVSIINLEFTMNQIKRILFLIYDISIRMGTVRIMDSLDIKPGFLTNKKQISDLICVFDERNKTQISKEARSQNIPVLSIIDTNNHYSSIDYPIIINNDLSQIKKSLKDSILKSHINGKKNSSIRFKYNYILHD